MELKEFELQTRFINENVDILQKYLIWKEFINEEPQILDSSIQIEAEDVPATYGNSTYGNTNYGINN